MRRITLDGESVALCPEGELEEKLLWSAIKSLAPEFVLRWLGDEIVVAEIRKLGLLHAPGPFDQGWHEAYVTLKVPFRVPTFHRMTAGRLDFMEELTQEPTLPIHFRLVLQERDSELLLETRIRPGRFSPEEVTARDAESFELILSYPELEGTPADVTSAEIIRDRIFSELRARRRIAWQPRIYETVTRCLTEWHFNTTAGWWIERENLDLEILIAGAAEAGQTAGPSLCVTGVATSLAAELSWREYPAHEAHKGSYMEDLGEILQQALDDKDPELRVLVDALMELDEVDDTYFEARQIAQLGAAELLTELRHPRMYKDFLDRFYAAKNPRQAALLAHRAHYRKGEKSEL